MPGSNAEPRRAAASLTLVEEGPILTVFRSRLRPEAAASYQGVAERMEEEARRQPGFVEFKTFQADDGERLSVIVFASQDDQDRWRNHPEHRAAQDRGRRDFYAEYDIAVCRVLRRRRFPEVG